MSILDWVNVGMHRGDKSIPEFNGSFAVTIGNMVQGIYGSRHVDIFGTDARLVCDIEDMLLSLIPLPTLRALVEGVGGSAAFIYGQNATATYKGPAITIRRGDSWTKAGNSFFPSAGAVGPLMGGLPTVPPVGHAAMTQYEMDRNLAILVATMSAILCLVTAGLELAVRFKYPTFNSSTNTDPTSTAQLLYDLAYTLSSRLMELIILMEQGGTMSLALIGYVDNCEKALTAIGNFFGQDVPAFFRSVGQWMKDNLKVILIVVGILVAIVAIVLGTLAVVGAVTGHNLL